MRDNGNWNMGRKLHSYSYHGLFRKMRNSVLIFLRIPSWVFSCAQNCKFHKVSQSVQSLSHVQLFAWTAAHQASLSFTISWSLPKLMSIESVIPSNHLILCHPLLPCLQSFPASGSFLLSWLFVSGGQSIEASASASVFPMIIQGWFPLGLIGLISLPSKGLSSLLQHHTLKASILWCSTFFLVQLSHPYWKNHSFD